MSQIYHWAFALLGILTMTVFGLLLEAGKKRLAMFSLFVAIPILVVFGLKHREALTGERLALLAEVPVEKYMVCRSQIESFKADPLAKKAYDAFEECVSPEQFAERRKKEEETVVISAIVASF